MIDLIQRRREMMAQAQGGLPAGYTQYDWVQADSTTGMPKIDTGYSMSAPINTNQHRYTIEGAFAKCENFASDWTARAIFCMVAETYSSDFAIMKQGNTTNKLSFVYNNRYGNKGNATETISNGIWHTFTLTYKDDYSLGGKLILDETTYTYTSDSNNHTTATMKLLINYPCRLARFKIYDYGVLAADLVPAKRDADDVIGFYDVVRNIFCEPSVEGVTLLCGNGFENFS